MTEIRQYLAEEVAEDLADGIITRREAVRRLGLMGVTGAAATGLLATVATGAPAAAASGDRDGEHGGTETSWAPVARESITFTGPRVPLMAAWAPAVKPRGGVLVIHENRGLNEHIRTVAGRLAASGYSALALDLLSEEGGTGAFPGEAEVAAALAQIPPERFDEDMQASVTELKRRVRGKKLAAIGFCFGGAMVWRLLAAGESRLAAAAPFYGPFPTGGNLAGARAAVLGVYGGLDARVNASRPVAKAALEAARLKHELLTFTEADHAFFNDTGTRFNPHAAIEAWRRALNWFDAADHHHGD
ncbi:carboxymethylenebutenolidase [Rhizocola hellebori]|uniref:Carboxymethylenebutenolidase n=1 Tax=Rhizocola hellebori TaxID=1392758 RepID=A0A8J3Q8Q5_9ACTN|nr:dienelactone hydrolase family protein [Rhizocola hellebori]GIH06104.1 carboxymethylenebutenolidase [Rhizocola hellebori]